MIPIGRFYGRGDEIEPANQTWLDSFRTASAGRRTVVKPGDHIPLKGAEVLVVSSDQKLLSRPVSGGGPNALCADAEQRAPAWVIGSISSSTRIRSSPSASRNPLSVSCICLLLHSLSGEPPSFEEPGVSPLRASGKGKLEEVAIEISKGAPVLFPPEKGVAEKLPSPDQLFQPAPPPGILNGEIQKLERPFHGAFKKGLISSLPPERAADLAADVSHLLREGEAAPSAVR
jgi:hypothetical protein